MKYPLTLDELATIKNIRETKGDTTALHKLIEIRPQYKDVIQKWISRGAKPHQIVEAFVRKSTAAKSPLEGFTYAGKRIPAIYQEEIQKGLKMMQAKGDTGLPSWAERVFGLIGYVASPITAIGKTAQELLTEGLKGGGVPHKVAEPIATAVETAIEVALPFAPSKIKTASSIGKATARIEKTAEAVKGEAKYLQMMHEATKDIEVDAKTKQAIQTIAEKFKDWQKLDKEIRKKIKEEINRRWVAYGKIIEENPTYEGWLLAKQQLKGELNYLRQSYPELATIFLDPEEFNGIIKYIAQSTAKPSLKEGAFRAITKAVAGTAPYKSELKALAEVISPRFAKVMEVYSDMLGKAGLAKWQQVVFELSSLPRTIMASTDFSGFLRQGAWFLGRKEFWKAAPTYFKSTFSKAKYEDLVKAIISDELYPIARKYGLEITELEGGLRAGEEMFMSQLAEKIPVLGKLVEMSERGYVSFLNKLRFDVFKHSYQVLKKNIKDPNELENVVRQLAKYINAATGRGDLPSFLRNDGYLLSQLFFAPRLMASRVRLLSDMFTGGFRYHPEIRKMFWKDAITFNGYITTLLMLAAGAGAEVSLNPSSSDFLKIRIGDMRIDPLAGFQQYLKTAWVLLSGKWTSSLTGKELELGEGYRAMTGFDVLLRFLQTKENPVIGFAIDMLVGKDFTGQRLDLAQAIVTRLIPMSVIDISELATGNVSFPLQVAGVLASQFGMGIQVYNINDHYDKVYKGAEKNDVDNKLALLQRALPSDADISLRLPMYESFETFNGVKIPHRAAIKWQYEFAKTVYPILNKYLNNPDFQKLTPYEQAETLHKVVEKVKKAVGYRLFPIPQGYIRKVVKRTGMLTQREIMKRNPNLSPEEIRNMTQKNIKNAENDIINQLIEERLDYLQWLEEQQKR